jgi:hypothetical protein
VQPTNPHARRLDVESDLKPVVEFLRSTGLSQEQIVKVGSGGSDGVVVAVVVVVRGAALHACLSGRQRCVD